MNSGPVSISTFDAMLAVTRDATGATTDGVSCRRSSPTAAKESTTTQLNAKSDATTGAGASAS